MKYYIVLTLTLFLFSCKNDKKETVEGEQNPPKISIEKSESFEEILPFDSIYSINDAELKKINSVTLKRKNLIEKKDDKDKLEQLFTQKTFKRDKERYLVDFTYPFLNENLKPGYANFNEYIEKTYLNIAKIEANILADQALCDTLRIKRFKEQRFVDYKIYSVNKAHISVLFYKENYYPGAVRPAYSFDCLNFDLQRSVFMNYEDFFNDGTEEEMEKILNEVLLEKINSGEMFYDCWAISFDDFFANKNNFVIDDNKIEYYFDDCVICPSYTGTYSVAIPLERLLPILRKYKYNPLM